MNEGAARALRKEARRRGLMSDRVRCAELRANSSYRVGRAERPAWKLPRLLARDLGRMDHRARGRAMARLA